MGYSWASVAVSAVAAELTVAANDALFGAANGNGIGRSGAWSMANPTASLLATSSVSALVSATTRIAFVGGRLSWEAVAADAIGSALRSSFDDARRGMQEKNLVQAQALAGRFGADLSNPEHLDAVMRAVDSQSRSDTSVSDRRKNTEDLMRVAGASNDDIRQNIELLNQHTLYESTAQSSTPAPSVVDNSIGGNPIRPIVVPTVNVTASRLDSAFGSAKVDGLMIGTGEVAKYISENIGAQPWLKYSLLTLDVAAGPAVFALRQAVDASPLGDAIHKAQESLVGLAADRFSGVGYTGDDPRLGGTGGFALMALGVQGAAGALQGVKNTLQHGGVNTTGTTFGPPRMGLDIPQGLSSSTFDRVSGNVRATVDRMGLGDDVFVMGSRAGGTAKIGSDLDIGVRMGAEQFDELIAKSFAGAKNARAATMEVAIRDGRIQAGEAGLSSLGKTVARDVGLPPGKVQISVIRAGGVFDNGPQSPLAYIFD